MGCRQPPVCWQSPSWKSWRCPMQRSTHCLVMPVQAVPLSRLVPVDCWPSVIRAAHGIWRHHALGDPLAEQGNGCGYALRERRMWQRADQADQGAGIIRFGEWERGLVEANCSSRCRGVNGPHHLIHGHHTALEIKNLSPTERHTRTGDQGAGDIISMLVVTATTKANM